MEDLQDEQKELIEEVLNALKEKFATLPITNRNILAIATVEAAAMIAAVESDTHGQLVGYGRPEVEDRIQEYVDIFRINALRSLADW